MITIISCTNRSNSLTRQIADYYGTILAELHASTQILDLKDLPEDFLFSALYENCGKHKEFNKITSILQSSEKFVFVVPEYNGSFPGVLKAFIDGMNFPSSFKNKKCALVGISSGSMGGALALSHLTDIFNYLGMHVLASKARLSKIESLYKNGNIIDPFLKDLLKSQAEALVHF